MKKVCFLVLVLIAVFLTSCGKTIQEKTVDKTLQEKIVGKTPQKKIIGKWDYVFTTTEGKGTMAFNSDGIMIYDMMPDKFLQWEIKGEVEPYQLIIYVDYKEDSTWELTFTSINEFMLRKKQEESNIIDKFILTRIK